MTAFWRDSEFVYEHPVRTAYHEAAHTHFYQKYGVPWSRVSVRRKRKKGGGWSNGRITRPKLPSDDRKLVDGFVMGLIAGGLAPNELLEDRAELFAGAGGDMRKALVALAKVYPREEVGRVYARLYDEVLRELRRPRVRMIIEQFVVQLLEEDEFHRDQVQGLIDTAVSRWRRLRKRSR